MALAHRLPDRTTMTQSPRRESLELLKDELSGNWAMASTP